MIDAVLATLPASGSSMRPVLNATGVVLHTNLGRAPLSAAAVEAVRRRQRHDRRRARPGDRPPGTSRRGDARGAAGGRPGRRGRACRQQRCRRPGAGGDRAGRGREIVVSRGELIEIGDGFRLPDLVDVHRRPAARGGHHQPNVTSPTTRPPSGPDTGVRAEGAPVELRRPRLHRRRSRSRELAGLPVAGRASTSAPACSRPTRCCPTSRTRRRPCGAGADLVTASGDKLLGGPQAGLLLGRRGPRRATAPAPAGPGAAGGQAHPRRLWRPPSPTPPTPTPDAAAHDGGARSSGECAPWPTAWSRRASRRPSSSRMASSAAAGRPRHRPAGVGRRAARRRCAGPLRTGDAGRRRPGRARASAARPALRAAGPGRRRRLRPSGPLPRLPGPDAMHVVATAGSRRPRQVHAGPRADRDGARPVGGGTPPRADDRPRLRLDRPRRARSTVAFVDVPGHERFVANMLAGVGPVPAGAARGRRRRGLDAADRGARRRTGRARRPARASLAVTRADLADPAPVAADVRERLARDLASGRRPVRGGQRADRRRPRRPARGARPAGGGAAAAGPGRPRPALGRPRPSPIRGAGTVVTGTLAAGTLHAGDELELGGRRVTVRGAAVAGPPMRERRAPLPGSR